MPGGAVHALKPAAKRAVGYLALVAILGLLGAAYVTDGFQRFDWPQFSHWAQSPAGEKP